MHTYYHERVYSADMEKLLTIDVLGWNGAEHLEATAKALATIPQEYVHICYIDNGSTDNSISIIEEILPHADIIRLEENIGFAAAHNKAILRCQTPYVLTLDQDQVVAWEGIQKLIDVMQLNPQLGAVQGKLYRKQGTPDHPLIDSAGIVQSLALNGIERGSNEADMGQYEKEEELLAVTGGCGLFRTEALRNIDMFDTDFFAYKEDVDAGWRLHKAGWEVRYIPVLASYHGRTLGKRGIFNWGITPSEITKRANNMRTKYSLRNYIWMLAKNASAKDILVHSPFIAVRLFVLFIISLFSPTMFAAWREAFAGVGKMRRKRI